MSSSSSALEDSPVSHRIPFDVLLSIIEQVDDLATLRQLSLVSTSVLQFSGKALYRSVELKTAHALLFFFHFPSLIPSSSRLRPYLGLPLLRNLSIAFPASQYPYSGTLVTFVSSHPTHPAQPDPIAVRLLAQSQPLLLDSLTFLASSRDSPIDESLRFYLSNFNPKRLVLSTPTTHPAFFSPSVRKSSGLREDFRAWRRLETVVFDGAALVELSPTTMLRTTLLPCVKGLFPSEDGAVPKMVFDMRRSRRKTRFDAWAGRELAKTWARWLTWLEDSGIRGNQRVNEGGVEVWVEEEEDERLLGDALDRVVGTEQERGRYRVVRK